MTIEELDRRNYSGSTKRACVQTFEDLARYFKRPPDQFEAAAYSSVSGVFVPRAQAVTQHRKPADRSLAVFFITVLRRSWSIAGESSAWRLNRSLSSG
jgi:hypothetical protein